MGTISQKMQAILDSKNEIKKALQDKGLNPSDVFSEYANLIVTALYSDENTIYLLVDGDTIVPTTLVDGPPLDITATTNDVRLGKKAILSEGLVEGTKDIPTYHTKTGSALIMPNEKFKIDMYSESYDYSALQAVIAPYGTSFVTSVAVDKTVIDSSVYPVQSTEKLSDVTKDSANKSIDFGIINGSEPYMIHYFTYKEVY